jgi:hypothetical protein
MFSISYLHIEYYHGFAVNAMVNLQHGCKHGELAKIASVD